MENSTETPLFESTIDDLALNELNAVGKWVKRVAIVCFALIALSIVFIFIMGSAFGNIGSYLPYEMKTIFDFDSSSAIFSIVMLVVFVLCSLYVFLLYKFGNNLLKATNYQDQDALESAFGSYKVYLIITGVLGIIALIFSLIGLLN